MTKPSRHITGDRPYSAKEEKIYKAAMEKSHAEYFEAVGQQQGISALRAMVRFNYPMAERKKAEKEAVRAVLAARIGNLLDEEKKNFNPTNVKTFTWQPRGNLRAPRSNKP